MMRVFTYVVILAALIAAPVDRLDVAQLEPVEVVYVSQNGNTVTIATDTGARGEGESLALALAELHETTPAVVYLDTAQYLLFDSESSIQIEQLRECLKGNVRICLAETVNFEDLVKYLHNHGQLPRLDDWQPGEPLPEVKDGKIV